MFYDFCADFGALIYALIFCTGCWFADFCLVLKHRCSRVTQKSAPPLQKNPWRPNAIGLAQAGTLFHLRFPWSYSTSHDCRQPQALKESEWASIVWGQRPACVCPPPAFSLSLPFFPLILACPSAWHPLRQSLRLLSQRFRNGHKQNIWGATATPPAAMVTWIICRDFPCNGAGLVT